MKKWLVLLTVPLILLFGKSENARAQANQPPIVRAVLFFSTSCPHCHYVINEVLVPLIDEYDTQLQILGINTSLQEGSELYQVAIERYQIPTERRGVPTLVVGEQVLVGSGEIPEEFPTIVEEALAAEGIEWPDLPGLLQLLPPLATPEPSATRAVTTMPSKVPGPAVGSYSTIMPTLFPQGTLSPIPTSVQIPSPLPESSAFTLDEGGLPPETFQDPPSDPVGFTIASVVLFGMVLTTGMSLRYTLGRSKGSLPLSVPICAAIEKIGVWVFPGACLLGLGISSYLAYVEISRVEAVCGPFGECNIVQSSPYAQLFGIPIAVFGVLFYLAVGFLWFIQLRFGEKLKSLIKIGLMGMTIFGTCFSIYLTCLELFVIRAICAWCLSSAVLTTILLLATVFRQPGRNDPLSKASS